VDDAHDGSIRQLKSDPSATHNFVTEERCQEDWPLFSEATNIYIPGYAVPIWILEIMECDRDSGDRRMRHITSRWHAPEEWPTLRWLWSNCLSDKSDALGLSQNPSEEGLTRNFPRRVHLKSNRVNFIFCLGQFW